MNKPLRWAGSKKWLIPFMTQIYAPYRAEYPVFWESFAGSAALSFGLMPDKVMLSDLNLHLIRFYQWLNKLENPLEIEPIRSKLGYQVLRHRANCNIRSGLAIAPEDFFLLNFHCYNGLFRVNSKGTFNVPYDPSRLGKVNRLHPFPWDCVPFWANVLDVDPPENAFIYLDPPYPGTFVGYNENQYSVRDLEALLSKPWSNPTVLSMGDLPLLSSLIKSHGFNVYQVKGRADMINRNTKGRKAKKEILAFRNINVSEFPGLEKSEILI